MPADQREPASAGDDSRCAVVWLRDDLRVSDNPALAAAVDSGAPIVALYVFDQPVFDQHGGDQHGGDQHGGASRPLGGASRWWLHHSLAALDASLQKRGSRLLLRRGAAEQQVASVLRQTNASHLFLNRRYATAEREQDERVEAAAHDAGVETSTFAAHLLYEPGEVLNGSGEMFGVFTPFWRAALRRGEPRSPLPAPGRIRGWEGSIDGAGATSLDELALLPTRPDWAGGLAETWQPGEKGAHRRLDEFVHTRLAGYAEGRDFPSAESSSRLSPHLKFGEVSPFQLWHRVQRADGVNEATRQKFLTELGWREFDWHLLATHPQLDTVNVHRQFDAFPWAPADDDRVRAWQQGRTGIPLVDAGMRELWHTGWMHNRVRMVVASFLIKNLRIDWRLGEQWFWDTLVDADPANNPAQWQWVAGSGADAAPYFRIFNPVTQAQKFDGAGEYVRRWVPELAGREGKTLFEPWTVPGGSYPAPIVDLKQSRGEALDAYEAMRR